MRFPFFGGREARSSIENPQVPVSAQNFLAFFTGSSASSASGALVNVETALGVPAVWAAVNFLAGTLAGLPLHLYRRGEGGPARVAPGRNSREARLAALLHDAANDETSSFQWRKLVFDHVFTEGRSFTFIERNGFGEVANLWPLDPLAMTVRRNSGRRSYIYRDGGREVAYEAGEIIDLAFLMKRDMLGHHSPIMKCRDAIGMAISATGYSGRLFDNGGVPPLVLEGPLTTPAGVKRAAEDIRIAVRDAAAENRSVLAIPAGHTLKPLGIDPEKQQLIELQRFSVEQIARIYQLPPTFLQDLTHGTFTNTEQQDLHVSKHTLKRWVEQFEQEINLKLFGRSPGRLRVEMNMDGLLRGSFRDRMEALARGVQNALVTPNEARALENRPPLPAGDDLMIQGATVPLGSFGPAAGDATRPAPPEESPEDGV